MRMPVSLLAALPVSLAMRYHTDWERERIYVAQRGRLQHGPKARVEGPSVPKEMGWFRTSNDISTLHERLCSLVLYRALSRSKHIVHYVRIVLIRRVRPRCILLAYLLRSSQPHTASAIAAFPPVPRCNRGSTRPVSARNLPLRLPALAISTPSRAGTWMRRAPCEREVSVPLQLAARGRVQKEKVTVVEGRAWEASR
ncbi:hypothetical protein K458DRAFT_123502 [Lentithecium fluviatile CBS 122367]|uniref:Secreted protein n=1 Tax=Lentithecium fluviatile CBS 122367 TaxID=1168545 RepID=A0A6G1JEU8_9PLEO|nr:hypothetical protein K458DRAFT_123502 [Lentithecium fluviatile CBS 122367]